MFRFDEHENLKRTRRERQRNAPKPLSKNRARQLTLPLPDAAPKGAARNPFKKAQIIHDQLQSSLSRLPREIRQMIWKYVLGDHVLHIVRLRRRLFSIKCGHNHQDISTQFHRCWGTSDRRSELADTPGFYTGPLNEFQPELNSFLPLLRTCRQIYSESVNTLYRDNRFDFNHFDSILYLSQSVLRKRLDEIQVISLHWTFKYPVYQIRHAAKPRRLDDNPPYDHATWVSVCHFLSSLKGLRELYLWMWGPTEMPGYSLTQEYFDPLYEIHPSSRFAVILPGDDSDWAELKDHHFEILTNVTPRPKPRLPPDNPNSLESLLQFCDGDHDMIEACLEAQDREG
ncbi:MAG: hypothetical protein M1820_000682 [Bogoriella megaspora]|nr:MAG: hypothetical protein M1820_000682 [Bogoriella megaspora]